MSTIWPNKWTPTTAAVDGVRASATASTSISNVFGSTSTKIGRAPTAQTASAVATKVLAGTMTSSPLPIPKPAKISSSASVPLATPTHSFASQKEAKLDSKRSTSSPPTN